VRPGGVVDGDTTEHASSRRVTFRPQPTKPPRSAGTRSGTPHRVSPPSAASTRSRSLKAAMERAAAKSLRPVHGGTPPGPCRKGTAHRAVCGPPTRCAQMELVKASVRLLRAPVGRCDNKRGLQCRVCVASAEEDRRVFGASGRRRSESPTLGSEGCEANSRDVTESGRAGHLARRTFLTGAHDGREGWDRALFNVG
jgi:hypothetical protein